MSKALRKRIVTLLLILLAVFAVGMATYTERPTQAQTCTYWDPCTGQCWGT